MSVGRLSTTSFSEHSQNGCRRHCCCCCYNSEVVTGSRLTRDVGSNSPKRPSTYRPLPLHRMLSHKCTKLPRALSSSSEFSSKRHLEISHRHHVLNHLRLVSRQYNLNQIIHVYIIFTRAISPSQKQTYASKDKDVQRGSKISCYRYPSGYFVHSINITQQN